MFDGFTTNVAQPTSIRYNLCLHCSFVIVCKAARTGNMDQVKHVWALSICYYPYGRKDVSQHGSGKTYVGIVHLLLSIWQQRRQSKWIK